MPPNPSRSQEPPANVPVKQRLFKGTRLFGSSEALSSRADQEQAGKKSLWFESRQSPSTVSAPPVATTVDERVSVLQTKYTAERESTPQPKPMPFGGVDGADDGAVDLLSMAIQGTCPDMCPELERYLREAHHRVSVSLAGM